MPVLKIADRYIGTDYPVYFIADIAANHDGNLCRAKDLMSLAKQSGAEAAKFQHFQAAEIVSEYGFNHLDGQFSHQSKWEKSVYQVYKDASLPKNWTKELRCHADKIGIHFFSSPYDFENIEHLYEYVPAYKIGSGDINWIEILEKFAKSQKPLIVATGASTLDEVKRAVKVITAINPNLALLQCNTNYTGSRENFKYLSLRVIQTYRELFSELVVGLSDHTPGYSAVLGAVALGARIIEKHFTDDNKRKGPDHAFSLTPDIYREMVNSTRELESALGSKDKKVEDNEKETVIIQRRCLRAHRDVSVRNVLKREDIDVLRPAEKGGIEPCDIKEVIGRRLRRSLVKGEIIRFKDLV